MIVFLNTNNELSERQPKKTILSTKIAKLQKKKKKCLGINLTKEEKDVYSKNCKPLKKETEEDTNKWKCTLC